jgi:hypothetical protein
MISLFFVDRYLFEENPSLPVLKTVVIMSHKNEIPISCYSYGEPEKLKVPNTLGFVGTSISFKSHTIITTAFVKL